MDTQRGGGTVEQLWRHFQAREWDAARALLTDDFVADWPHTGERMVGPDNFIAVNENYPGEWQLELRRVVQEGDQAASEVAVTHVDDGTFFGASFFELRGGKIARATEYWISHATEAPPQWRAQWVERYE